VLALAAPLDQVADGEDAEVVLPGEDLERGQPHHVAVLVHDLAHRGDGLQAREAAQVGRRLGVAGAPEHAAGHGAQREHVPRAHEVLGHGRRLRQGP
jgi:hypothetical protein